MTGTLPLEFTGPVWQDLAARLGYRSVADWLGSDDIVLRPTPRGWSASWVRYYNGVRSDRRWVENCRSLMAVAAQINACEDEGDRDDERRRAAGEEF